MPVPLQLPCLCLVADTSVVGVDELLPRVASAVAGGVGLVQLRAKELPGGALLNLASQLKRAIEGRALLLVNERVDVASVAGADGVQLGEEALPVRAARTLLPVNSIVGRSVHSVPGAREAQSEGADFLLVGTMFATGSHPGAAPAGPGLMRDVREYCSIPLVGIGGITPENVSEIVSAGADGVAVIRSILGASDPRRAAEDLNSALLDAWQSRQPSSQPEAARSP